MGIKIDGRVLAEKHKEQLIARLKDIKSDRTPTIVSFCNTEDEPSVRYTQMKKQKAQEIEISFLVEGYDTKTSYEDLKQKVEGYNNSESVDGIMVQLPLPLDLIVFRDDLLDRINPRKDVDGLTYEGQKYFMPATVKSVISILEAEVPGWRGCKVAVVGADGEVGKPLLEVLSDELVPLEPLQLVAVDRNRGDLNHDLKDCEIIISATGRKDLIKPEMLDGRPMLIDVGLGDFNPACFEKAYKYTGEFGGVGPMTVISLMENVVDSFENRIKKL